jgi:hypothetical protein
MKKLGMDQACLNQARSGLIRKNLVAWQKPIYQVLSLDSIPDGTRTGTMMSLKDILGGAR